MPRKELNVICNLFIALFIASYTWINDHYNEGVHVVTL